MLLLLLSVGFAIAASCLCSLTEASLLSLSLGDIAELCERRPGVGRIWRAFREGIHKPISVILIINTLATAMGAAFSGAQFNALFGVRWLVVYSVGFSVAMILFGEILPKTAGVRFNRAVAGLMAYPLKAGVWLLTPVLYVIGFMTRPFAGSAGSAAGDAMTEISVLVRFAALNRVITRQQERIVSRGMNLSHMRVQDVMVKRSEIKYLSSSMTLAEALVASHVHHHTRYLLVKDNDVDAVAGYVNFKDIVSALQLNPRNPTLDGITRPVLRVSPGENLAAVMGKMTGGHHHMALAQDTRGVTMGLITLEDIVESLIGSIQDEYDILPAHVHQVAEGHYFVGGGVSLHVLREKTGIDVPDTTQTVDEWLRIDVLRRQPEPEERVRVRDGEFVVKKTRRSRLFELALDVVKPAADTPATTC